MKRSIKKFVFNYDLAPNTEDFVDFQNIVQVDSLGQPTQKYVPLKNLQIINISTETLHFFENDSGSYEIIPAGVIRELTNRNIYRFKIKNTGSVNNAVFHLTIDNDFSNEELTERLLIKLGGGLDE